MSETLAVMVSNCKCTLKEGKCTLKQGKTNANYETLNLSELAVKLDNLLFVAAH